MNRGSDHQAIFKIKEDYEQMLKIIELTKEKYPFYLHAFCLMSNHYHFLIETEDDDIAVIMKKIDGTYTRYFNHKYERDGSLFRGRYNSCEVFNDIYFMQVSRYISLNPVNAYMVKRPEDYFWSSYRAYIGKGTDEITDTSRTINMCDRDVEFYKSFVNSKIQDEEITAKINTDIGEI